jgi:hypothetical protein
MRKTMIAVAACCSIVLATPAAHAGGWHHWHRWHHHDNGAMALGAIALGLGVASAILAPRYPERAYVPAPAYYPPPRVYYRPPPVFYAAPRPYWPGWGY